MATRDGLIRGVSVIIRNGKRFLMLKRSSSNRHFSGKWESVSGKIEPDETAYDAARREVSEETGLRVEIHSKPMMLLDTELGDNKLNLTYFLADYIDGDVRVSREHSEFGWYSQPQLGALDIHAETACLINGLELSPHA